MITLLWNVSTAVRDYLRAYMPTNILLDLIRTRGHRWGIPTALGLIPTYLFAASFTTVLLRGGGPGWLNLLFLLFMWNAFKFASVALISLVLVARAQVAKRSARGGNVGYQPGRSIGPWTTLDRP